MTTDLREHLQATLGGAYTLERELGGGGMSRVFLAEETSLRRHVVVKVLAPELGAGLNADRFRREIHLAAHLQHPHVVPLLSAGERAGLLYYTMPFVDGESLRARLDHAGELPVGEATRLLRDIADALAYAHRKGVVHRDLKPANVLLEEGHALVADFGVAKALAAAADADAITSVGIALGTPAYMAPEQAAADPATDHRADIYAFGVVAYELLAGRAPFAHRSAHAQLAAHAAEVPEPVTAHRSSIPADLAAMVMRCLEKRPADRPQRAEEVLAVLETARTPPAEPLGTGRPAAPGPRWRQRPTVMAAAVGFALVGAGIAATLHARRGPDLDSKRIAVAVFDNQTGDPTLDPLGRMAADWLTQGLMQTQLLDVVPSSSTLYGGPAAERTDRDGRLSAADRLRALAVATGAGTVVSGAYYREGDSLRFQAQVTDVGRGKLLRAMEPVSGVVERPTAVVERLRQRVTATLAALLDPNLVAMSWNNIEPPSYEAYREYMLGLERHYRMEFPEAIARYARAAALDSTSSQSTANLALVWAAAAYGNMGRHAEADSVARLVAARRERLAPLERHSVDWQLAIIRGDYATSLEHARRMHELTPGSDFSEMTHGFAAMRVNRPREAIAAFAWIDERGPIGEWPSYWRTLTSAHHVLRDHRGELAVARRGRERFPTLQTLWAEVRALAAAGKLADVEERLDESRTLSPQQEWTPADVMVGAALELRAHGHVGAAPAAVDRAIRWYRTRSPGEQTSAPARLGLGRALYAAGRWEEARGVFDRLATDMPNNPDYLGHRGVLAARRGDRVEAARASAQLAALTTPYLRGQHTRWRARIAAVLGDREGAVALLRDAFAQGTSYFADPVPHVDVDFESLRGYGPYEELLRPQG